MIWPFRQRGPRHAAMMAAIRGHRWDMLPGLFGAAVCIDCQQVIDLEDKSRPVPVPCARVRFPVHGAQNGAQR